MSKINGKAMPSLHIVQNANLKKIIERPVPKGFIRKEIEIMECKSSARSKKRWSFVIKYNGNRGSDNSNLIDQCYVAACLRYFAQFRIGSDSRNDNPFGINGVKGYSYSLLAIFAYLGNPSENDLKRNLEAIHVWAEDAFRYYSIPSNRFNGYVYHWNINWKRC